MTGNMYENIKTWNPLNGKCSHDCTYCSSKSLRQNVISFYQGKLRLNENAFKKNLGSGNTWFVCAQNDLFAENVPEEFIIRILAYIRRFPENEYLLQTKNPIRIIDFIKYLPGNVSIGTTIESNRDYCLSKAPSPYERGSWMSEIHDEGLTTFLTIEPIMHFDLVEFIDLLRDAKPNWINVGADSKEHDLPEPPAKLIEQLICELRTFTEIRIKSNLERLLK